MWEVPQKPTMSAYRTYTRLVYIFLFLLDRSLCWNSRTSTRKHAVTLYAYTTETALMPTRLLFCLGESVWTTNTTLRNGPCSSFSPATTQSPHAASVQHFYHLRQVCHDFVWANTWTIVGNTSSSLHLLRILFTSDECATDQIIVSRCMYSMNDRCKCRLHSVVRRAVNFIRHRVNYSKVQ